MITKELVEQWVDEAIDKYMTQDAHFMYVANAAAAHGAAQAKVPLTEEEVRKILGLVMPPLKAVMRDVRRIEAHHGISGEQA